ncbi:MAG TPA: hypothetical protein VGF77_08530 [Allosphingosinicella sp.]|jgi:hypothetical protein
MGVQADVSGLVGHWRTVAGSYDAANTRLRDLSGFGNHLPLVTGAPDFTVVRDGRTGMKMHGDAYFGGKNVLPAEFTMISVLWPNLLGTESFYPFYATRRTFANVNDPAWQTPTDTLGVTNLPTALRLRLFGGNATFGDNTFGFASAAYTSSAWRVITCVLDVADGYRKIRIDNGAWVINGPPTQQRNMLYNDEFYLGLFPGGTITTSGGQSLTSLQHIMYIGDVTQTDNSDYEALITALLANPAV